MQKRVAKLQPMKQYPQIEPTTEIIPDIERELLLGGSTRQQDSIQKQISITNRTRFKSLPAISHTGPHFVESGLSLRQSISDFENDAVAKASEENLKVNDVNYSVHSEAGFVDNDGCITTSLILKKNMPGYKESTQGDMNEYLSNCTHIRMDRCKLKVISNLESFTKLTNLYLQHNQIQDITGLSHLKNLRFLVLHNNCIYNVSGISSLNHLQYIDISNNGIQKVNSGDFPKSIEILVIKGNPCSQTHDYRLPIVYALPQLDELDEIQVTKSEKRISIFTLGTNDERLHYIDNPIEEIETDIVITDTSNSNFELPSSQFPFQSIVNDIIKRSKQRQNESASEYKLKVESIKERIKKSSRDRIAKIREKIIQLEND